MTLDPEVRERLARGFGAIVDEIEDMARWLQAHDGGTAAARDPRVVGLRRQERQRERLRRMVHAAHPPPPPG